METRLLYLPIADVQEDMVLGAPVVLAEQGVSNFTLPAGHPLTESNIHQMAVRHAEFVCVQQADQRTPEEREAEWAMNEMRLQHVFRSADLNDPTMARLYQAVLAFRRT